MRSRPYRTGRPDIVLYGGPGSGKSTQAGLLAKKLSARYLNMGASLRLFSRSQSHDGILTYQLLAAGKLAPVRITNGLVQKFVGSTPLRRLIIFDGYPRNLIQLRFFEKLLPRRHRFAVMVYIKLPIAAAKQRLLKRARTENRADDQNVAALTERLRIFHREAKTLLAHYRKQKLLITINGNQTISRVTADIYRAVRVLQ